MATIKEVAQRAGVSVATVSRYVNKTGIVNVDTAARISEAIRALDYLPNRQARNLRTTHTNYILVLVPSIENSFLSRVIQGIQQVGGRRGYSIIIGITRYAIANEKSYLNLVKSRGVDGIISVSPAVGGEAMEELYRDFPIVQCSEYCTQEVPYVTVNNRAAAYEIAELLIQCGCRRPGLILSDLPIISFQEREAGYMQAFADHGIEPCRVVHVPLGFSTGKKAAEQLLEFQPDGILAVADILALGAIRHLLDAGLRVPEDISVAGFDGIPLSRDLKPSLTTVIQPAYEMGKTAARMIIDRIEGNAVENRILLPHRIAVRASTPGAPNQFQEGKGE